MKWSVALFTALLLIHITLYVFMNNPASLAAAGNVFQGFALLAAAIVFTQFATKSTKEETAIRNMLALGFWVWVMSHALLSYSELLLKQPATGSVTDAIWLIGYCLIIRALYLLLCRSNPRSKIRMQFFGLLGIVLIVVCAVLWNIISNPNLSTVIRFLNVIFPLLDFMIVGLALLIVTQSHRPTWIIGAVASTIVGITDLTYPYFDNFNSPMYRYLDIPLFVGYSLWWLQAMALVAGWRRAIQTAPRPEAGVTDWRP